MTVAYMGNAMNCLNVSIHSPGLGNLETQAGKIDNNRYGKESPSAIQGKDSIGSLQSIVSAVPTATPRKRGHTWSRHNRCQNAGEKRSGIPIRSRDFTTNSGQ